MTIDDDDDECWLHCNISSLNNMRLVCVNDVKLSSSEALRSSPAGGGRADGG